MNKNFMNMHTSAGATASFASYIVTTISGDSCSKQISCVAVVCSAVMAFCFLAGTTTCGWKPGWQGLTWGYSTVAGRQLMPPLR